MVELEKRGIPTVTIVAEPFFQDAKTTARALGLKEFAQATVQTHALTNQEREEVNRLVDQAMSQVIEGLTREMLPEKESGTGPKTVRFAGKDLLQALDAMNERFLDEGWGDGFPIVAPTEEAVAAMLKGTKRSPDELVCVLEPGMGRATVEKIAINAVMAGCRPSYLPVVIAAVEAMTAPTFNLRTMAVSTGPHAPLIVVNGPIAKKIGVNSGMGALGPGPQSRANTAIGRALRLAMMNIGQARVGVLDMDTIGSANKYSMCLAENEDKNPWEPLHVERGFKRETSAVTVFAIDCQVDINNLASQTPEDLLMTFSASAALPGVGAVQFWPLGRGGPLGQGCGHSLLLVCPDHAAVISKHGWSKQDVKEYVYHQARIPAGLWRRHVLPERIPPGFKWLSTAPEEALIPVAGGPDWFHIVVVGAAAGKSAHLIGIGEPSTREILE